MTRWIQILGVFIVVLALSPDAHAQGFGNSNSNGVGASGQSAGQFSAVQNTAPVSAGAGGSFGASSGYSLGPQDVLDISVFGVPELSGSLVIADNGTIQFPLIGEVQAAGKTARALQLDLAQRLSEDYLQNPQVLVSVKEFNSRRVTLTGEIMKPGVYPLKGRTSLLQLIAVAGGVGEGSDSNVLIIRNEGGKRKAARFNVTAIEKGTAQDPLLRPGDTIVAGSSIIKRAYKGFMKALPIAGAFAIL